MPVYPGGAQGLLADISNNLFYPAAARRKGIQGRVIVAFVVNPEGKMTDFRIKKSVDPLLDAEALCVMRKLRRWKPGTQNGVPISVTYDVPVTFSL
jgi:TonB family protein